jgi:hypothetical protein
MTSGSLDINRWAAHRRRTRDLWVVRSDLVEQILFASRGRPRLKTNEFGHLGAHQSVAGEPL